jgi:hypothetical protein
MSSEAEKLLMKYNEKRKTTKSIVVIILRTLGLFLITTLLSWLATETYTHLRATSQLEFERIQQSPAFFFEQGLESSVKVIFDGKPVDTISLLEIKLYNRTTKDIPNLDVNIELTNFSSQRQIKPIRKLLLYNDNMDGSWVNWNDSLDLDNLGFSTKIFKSSWNKNDYISIRLFFDTANVPGVKVKTSTPDVRFVDYDKSAEYWFLFGADQYVYVCLAILLPGILLYSLWRITDVTYLWRIEWFSRSVNKSVQSQGKELTSKEIIKIAVYCFTQSLFTGLKLTPSNDCIVPNDYLKDNADKQ